MFNVAKTLFNTKYNVLELKNLYPFTF